MRFPWSLSASLPKDEVDLLDIRDAISIWHEAIELADTQQAFW
jgi:hypothetical protein